MNTMEHPDVDLLLSASAGEPAALRDVRAHLLECEPCRRRFAKVRGVLATAAEELLDMRPGCPEPDELAGLPPGSEDTHPHVASCPLCREEIRLLAELESERRLGFTLEHGPLIRPDVLQHGAGAALYQDAAGRSEMLLDEGAELTLAIGGGEVRLSCRAGELKAAATGQVPATLVLVLSDAALEKRVRWATGDALRIAVDRWQRVRVEDE